jgi:hypothetical protein
MSLDFSLYFDIDTGNLPYSHEIFTRNITHNVGTMWLKAGVYDVLYGSEGRLASDIIKDLEKGCEDMIKYPEEYELLNPSNGWGDYEGALYFLKDVMDACKSFPKARIEISK